MSPALSEDGIHSGDSCLGNSLVPWTSLHFQPLFSTIWGCGPQFRTPLPQEIFYLHSPRPHSYFCHKSYILHQLRPSYPCSMSESSCDYWDLCNVQCWWRCFMYGRPGPSGTQAEEHLSFKTSNGFSRRHVLTDSALSKQMQIWTCKRTECFASQKPQS